MSEQATSPETAAKPKKNNLLIPLVAVLALGGAGFGGWRMISAKGASASDEAPEKPSKKHSKRPSIKTIMHLEPFVVNMGGPEDSGYLRVGIDLGLDKEESGGEEDKKKGGGPTAIIRDTVLTVLGKTKSEDLLTPEGKEKLKKDLLAAIDERLPDLGVEEVLFNEFIIQK